MASRTSLSVVLAERPKGDIVPGKTFAQKTSPAPTADDLEDGQILIETLYLSLDPAMRGWLNDGRSYIPPVELGAVMRGDAIGRVLASKSRKAKPGDVVKASTGWQEVAVASEGQFQPPLELPANGRATDLLGVLGLTGLTAYFGLREIGQVRRGDTVVVSGAAGATGSVVGQIAKHIHGAGKVIGLAGADDKCRWLTEELGFDVALNYKDPDFKKKFVEATPNYVNVYWDNVGGDILELALARAAFKARFVECGMISQYNSTNPQGPRTLMQIVAQRIKMQGFIVFDFKDDFPTAQKELAQWITEGKVKRNETIRKGGLQNIETAWQELFKGANTGKLLVEVKNPDDAWKL